MDHSADSCTPLSMPETTPEPEKIPSSEAKNESPRTKEKTCELNSPKTCELNSPKDGKREAPVAMECTVSKKESDEECTRERLKKHRQEMAGQVWIPDIWGQENFLKDWKDCNMFDRSLVPKGLVSARDALVEECRRSANSSRSIRIQKSC